MSTDWSSRYARRLKWMTTSAIRDIFKYIQSADVISFAGGWPAADLFPIAQLDAVSHDVLTQMPQQSLQYGQTDGLPMLRQAVAEHMTQNGIPTTAENIVIISGSQQGLDLVGRIMLDEGDTVLVESPSFIGAIQAFNAYGARYATVPLDENGLCVDQLEAVIERTQPKFMYLLPTFQNPTGVTLSLERRHQVVEIAGRLGVPILEDDPYGPLRFAGDPLPSLLALDVARDAENAARRSYVRGNVIYLSTFSKTLAPGLRVAWAVCPPEIAQNLVMAKQGSDLHTSALPQAMAYEFLRRGWLPAQVERIRDTYRERSGAMCEAIASYFPKVVHYTRPEGGLFLWITLPEQIDTVELLKEAVEHKVVFVPGRPFYVDGGGRNTMRLSFATVPPAVIREGIKRLGEVIARHL